MRRAAVQDRAVSRRVCIYRLVSETERPDWPGYELIPRRLRMVRLQGQRQTWCARCSSEGKFLTPGAPNVRGPAIRGTPLGEAEVEEGLRNTHILQNEGGPAELVYGGLLTHLLRGFYPPRTPLLPIPLLSLPPPPHRRQREIEDNMGKSNSLGLSI